MGIKHLKADSKIEHILEVLDQDAGLIIDNVVSSDGLEKIKLELAPYLKNNIKGDNEFTGFQTKTILAVPVFNHDGAVIGVLEAINKNSNNENHFTTDDEQLLVSISSHIGVAISSILGEHNEKKELMTVLKLVKHHHT